MGRSLVDDKAALRARMKAVRAAIPPPDRAAAAHALLEHLPADGGTIVSGFLPIGEEIDPRPLMLALAARGSRLCLPVIQGRGRPLLFRAWSRGDQMVTKAWGIQEPMADQPVLIPDLMLVPLLAVDRRGNRLGYGAGYYDRTIAAIRATGAPLVTIGLAFDEQIVDAVPHSDYDMPLDRVLTPSGLRQCQGTG